MAPPAALPGDPLYQQALDLAVACAAGGLSLELRPASTEGRPSSLGLMLGFVGAFVVIVIVGIVVPASMVVVGVMVVNSYCWDGLAIMVLHSVYWNSYAIMVLVALNPCCGVGCLI